MILPGHLVAKYLDSKINIDSKNYLISIDTRELSKDVPSCFVAIVGERFDGHDFVNTAYANGAEIIIVKKGFKTELPVQYILEVEDTQKALQNIARGIRNDSNIPWIALTGSVGKTSTRHVISKVLRKKGSVLETKKNNNNQIGVPLTVLGLESKHDFAVVEAGTNHFGEIKPLAEILEPDFSVITNIGRVHVEHLKDEFGVAVEKGELLKFTKKSGLCLLNADSLCFEELRAMCNARVISFGMQSGDIQAIVKEQTSDEIIFSIENNDFIMPNIGVHFIYNFLPAYIIGKELGVSIEDMQEVAQVLGGVAGRLEIKLSEPIELIDDSYNASVDSMKAAITFLSQKKNAKRRVAILGDMKELGGFSKDCHKNVLDAINQSSIDLVLALGEEWGRIIDGCVMEWEHFKNKETLIQYCLSEIQSGDAILVKASNSVRFSEVVDKIFEAWKVK